MMNDLLPILFGIVLIVISGRFCWRCKRRVVACSLWVLAVWVLVAGWLMSNRMPGSRTREKNSCIANLKQLDGAIQAWVLEKRKDRADRVDVAAVKDYLRGSQLPVCPLGGSYSFGQVKDEPKCSLAKQGHTL